MDPFTLTYFGIILPIAVLASVFFIIRFKRNYRSQLKNFKADEIAARSRRQQESPRDNTEAFDIEIDAPAPRRTSSDGE